MRPCVLFVCVLSVLATPAMAQPRPYFVTYDHYLEEAGSLEIAVASTSGFPRAGRGAYTAPWLELEYGVTGWWTSELYLEGITTRRDGSAFTGWRWEQRVRPMKGEHWINPVLYVEYERVNDASRIQKEIVGSGPVRFEPIAALRQTTAHELEGKIILSSRVAGWNVAENFVIEKNLSEDEGFEFGYSLGVSRPLGGLASATRCRVCRENFVAGVELSGGLGSSNHATLGEARHYLAPVLAWQVTERSAVKVSTGFGLTSASDHVLIRVSYAYELPLGGR